MDIEDILGAFVSEVARQSVQHLASLAGHPRVCSSCRNDNLQEFSLTLPCCGRVLCGACAADSLLGQWQTRCVVRCDHCQTAHTFDLST
jgi:hypothetical protein